MAIAWPVSVPDCADSWEEQAEPITLRTQMDIGPAKVRRRATRAVRTIRVSFILTHAQALALRAFFDVTLQSGVNEHSFRHPFTGNVEAFRFTAPPSISNNGALACSVSCTWEQL